MRKNEKELHSDLLTKKQVAAYFSVSIGTINHWVKKRLLTAYSVGSRIYFKCSELNEALIQIN